MSKKLYKTKSQRSWSVYLATTVLIVSLSFVSVTVYQLVLNAKHEQEWISLATDVQVRSQQLAKSAGEAASGNLDAFNELENARTKTTVAMNKLRLGSSETALPPTPAEVELLMKKLDQTWDRMSTNAGSILDRKELIRELTSARSIVQENIPGIQKHTDTTIRALTESGAPTNQLVFASRQLVLADRILRRVAEVLQGGSHAVIAADNLRKDRDLFAQVLSALQQGSTRLGITQVRNTQALPKGAIAFHG